MEESKRKGTYTGNNQTGVATAMLTTSAKGTGLDHLVGGEASGSGVSAKPGSSTSSSMSTSVVPTQPKATPGKPNHSYPLRSKTANASNHSISRGPNQQPGGSSTLVGQDARLQIRDNEQRGGTPTRHRSDSLASSVNASPETSRSKIPTNPTTSGLPTAPTFNQFATTSYMKGRQDLQLPSKPRSVMREVIDLTDDNSDDIALFGPASPILRPIKHYRPISVSPPPDPKKSRPQIKEEEGKVADGLLYVDSPTEVNVFPHSFEELQAGLRAQPQQSAPPGFRDDVSNNAGNSGGALNSTPPFERPTSVPLLLAPATTRPDGTVDTLLTTSWLSTPKQQPPIQSSSVPPVLQPIASTSDVPNTIGQSFTSVPPPVILSSLTQQASVSQVIPEPSNLTSALASMSQNQGVTPDAWMVLAAEYRRRHDYDSAVKVVEGMIEGMHLLLPLYYHQVKLPNRRELVFYPLYFLLDADISRSTW